MNKYIWLHYLLIVAALSLFLNSCAIQTSKINPLYEKKAIVLSKKAQEFNKHITTSKGTGWLRVETKKEFSKFKIAWAAAAPDKIRITLLITGHPVETIISNGKSITLISHTGEHPKKTYFTRDANLKQYINVPVKISEIITMLLGRLNVMPFDTAEYIPSESPDSPAPSDSPGSVGPEIILKKNWGSAVQTLSYNQDEIVNKLVLSDLKGKPIYHMNILKYKSFEFGELPVKVEVDDLIDRKLTLTILNFEPNLTIKESLFQLAD